MYIHCVLPFTTFCSFPLAMSSSVKPPEPTGTTVGPSEATGFSTGTLIGEYQYHYYIFMNCALFVIK